MSSYKSEGEEMGRLRAFIMHTVPDVSLREIEQRCCDLDALARRLQEAEEEDKEDSDCIDALAALVASSSKKRRELKRDLAAAQAQVRELEKLETVKPIKPEDLCLVHDFGREFAPCSCPPEAVNPLKEDSRQARDKLGILLEKCPNALLPDGPVCPRCSKARGPSGVDGGSWVHMPEEDSG